MSVPASESVQEMMVSSATECTGMSTETWLASFGSKPDWMHPAKRKELTLAPLLCIDGLLRQPMYEQWLVRRRLPHHNHPHRG